MTNAPKGAIRAMPLMAVLWAAMAICGASMAQAPATALDEVARLKAEQEAPRQVVPFDPGLFDAYVGAYQLLPYSFATITREGDKYFVQLTGQDRVEVYPESPTKFFATRVAAQFSFVAGPDGKAGELVLHQNGRELHANRVDEATMDAALARLSDRIKQNRPSPGTEDFLRRYVKSEEEGNPDYRELTPALEAAARTQDVGLRKDLDHWGPLKSVAFDRVTSQGDDVYELTFQNAKIETVVAPFNTDGKIPGLFFHELP